MTKNLHFLKEDYFPYLIKNFKMSVLALEYLGNFKLSLTIAGTNLFARCLLKIFFQTVNKSYLIVDDLHNCKELTINKFFRHSGSEDFLWGIVKLMSNENLRVSGNSAYVFGTLGFFLITK